jgi:anti-anti-sigma regulatory factor
MSTAPHSLDNAFAAAEALSSLTAKFVETEQEHGSVVVRALGPNLGQRECPAILEAAVEALRQRPKNARFFVFDLSNVRTFSALGLGLCQDLAKRVAEQKMKPVLFGLSGPLLDQLRMFKTDRLYPVVRSRGDLISLTGS